MEWVKGRHPTSCTYRMCVLWFASRLSHTESLEIRSDQSEAALVTWQVPRDDSDWPGWIFQSPELTIILITIHDHKHSSSIILAIHKVQSPRSADEVIKGIYMCMCACMWTATTCCALDSSFWCTWRHTAIRVSAAIMSQPVLWIIHVKSTKRTIFGANSLLPHENNYPEKYWKVSANSQDIMTSQFSLIIAVCQRTKVHTQYSV